MIRYTGKIKTRKQAEALAARLERIPNDARARDAARYLRQNWQAVAARPMSQIAFFALADGHDERESDRLAHEQDTRVECGPDHVRTGYSH